MSARKVTPGQVAVLRAAKDGRLSRSESIGTLYESFMRPRTSAFTEKKVTAIVKRLTDRETPLLEIGERERWSRPWHLTAAGEAVLAACPADSSETGPRPEAQERTDDGCPAPDGCLPNFCVGADDCRREYDGNGDVIWPEGGTALPMNLRDAVAREHDETEH